MLLAIQIYKHQERSVCKMMTSRSSLKKIYRYNLYLPVQRKNYMAFSSDPSLAGLEEETEVIYGAAATVTATLENQS